MWPQMYQCINFSFQERQSNETLSSAAHTSALMAFWNHDTKAMASLSLAIIFMGMLPLA